MKQRAVCCARPQRRSCAVNVPHYFTVCADIATKSFTPSGDFPATPPLSPPRRPSYSGYGPCDPTPPALPPPQQHKCPLLPTATRSRFCFPLCNPSMIQTCGLFHVKNTPFFAPQTAFLGTRVWCCSCSMRVIQEPSNWPQRGRWGMQTVVPWWLCVSMTGTEHRFLFSRRKGLRKRPQREVCISVDGREMALPVAHSFLYPFRLEFRERILFIYGEEVSGSNGISTSVCRGWDECGTAMLLHVLCP